MVRWVVGSISYGGLIELFLVPTVLLDRAMDVLSTISASSALDLIFSTISASSALDFILSSISASSALDFILSTISASSALDLILSNAVCGCRN